MGIHSDLVGATVRRFPAVKMVPRIAAVIFLLLGQSQSLQKPIIGIENIFDSLKGHIDDIFCQYKCRKFEVKACKDDTEKRCTMVYSKECETTEVLDCHDEYRDECKTVYTETCETTYKEKTCKKVPVENCVKKKVPVCQTVPKKTCKNVPKSECHEAHVRKPFSKSVEECKVKEFYEHLRYEDCQDVHSSSSVSRQDNNANVKSKQAADSANDTKLINMVNKVCSGSVSRGIEKFKYNKQCEDNAGQ